MSSAFRISPEDYNSLIKDSALFDRDVLDKERQRITTQLRRRGYYAFNRDYLAYLADSSYNRNIVDLDLVLKPYRLLKPDGSVIDTLHRQYYIKDVTIVTDYDPLNQVQSDLKLTSSDTVKVGDLRFYMVRAEEVFVRAFCVRVLILLRVACSMNGGWNRPILLLPPFGH